MRSSVARWVRITGLLCFAVLAGALAGCGSEIEPSQQGTVAPAADVSPAAATAAASAVFPIPAAVPGKSFWYGDDITEVLPPPLATNLNTMLQSFYMPIQGAYAGFENTPDFRPDLPAPAGKGLKIYNSAKAWSGYTLLTSLGTDSNCVPYDATNPSCNLYGAILVDMNGNKVKEWSLTGFPAKMLPGGYVLGGVLNQGVMTSLVQKDWCDKTVHEWPVPQEPGYGLTGWHHDFERSGNPVGYYTGDTCWLPEIDPTKGTTLLLANHVVGGDGITAPPASTSSISTHPLYDDSFYEIDAAGNQLWSWHAWEHVGQMGFDQKALDAIYNVQVAGAPGAATDWTHMNQVARLGANAWYNQGDLRFHPDNLIFDSRSSSMLAIVARNDHPTGLWKAGDIVWRVGPNYGYGNPEYSLGEIIGPHNTHMIPQGLPGAGNILVFDNGGFSGFGSLITGLPGTWPNKFRFYSRVVEFNPVTLKVVWEYAVPHATDSAPKFFSTLISNIQRLKNGNTLVTQGGSGRVFEVTRNGEIVWDYRSPFGARRFGGPPLISLTAVYRAYRIPASWVPAKQSCPLPANWAPLIMCR